MNQRSCRPARGQVSASVLSLVLAACSSGGGANSRIPNPGAVVPSAPSTPSSPSLTANDYRTAEYNTSWALEAMHAAETYAEGYTGAGVNIGFVDFNFEFGSQEVRYSGASRGPDQLAMNLYRAQTGSDVEADRHGLAVATTAAGLRNNLGIHGVAFDATVTAVDYFSMANETQQVVGGKRYRISDPWTYLTDRNVRIISKSYGYDTGDIIANPPNVQEYYVVSSAARVVENGGLLVSSAGNNSGADPNLSNLNILEDIRAANLTNGPGAFIIVGAVDRNHVIASFSNRGGVAKDYFLVAPGVDITMPYNGALTVVSGTSFAAPLVAGAAAVVQQRWPTLTARQLADVLFASATDLGAAGVDSVYGHGLVNLGAALRPIGTTSFAVEAGAPAVAGSGLVLGASFGDAPELRAALRQAVMFDSFGRDFSTDASHLVWSRPRHTSLGDYVRRQSLWQAAQYSVGSGTLALHLQDDATRRIASATGLESEQAPQAVVQFTGAGPGFAWSAGSGLPLENALAPRQSPFAPTPLTRGFGGVQDHALSFVAAHVPLDNQTTVSFGLSQSGALGADAPIAALRESGAARSAAVRLDRVVDHVHLDVTLGAVLEQDALLGGGSAGGLEIGGRSATMWGGIGAEAWLAPQWIMRAAVAVATTDVQPVAASLIAIERVLSTTASFGIVRSDIFAPGDALSFTMSQPLHAESAPARVITARRDENEVLRLSRTASSLVPSGRELALEGNYRLRLGAWSAEAAFAYRFDAGHVAGARDAAGLVSLSRAF